MNYTSAFAVVARVGLSSTRLLFPQIQRLYLFVTRWPSTRDAQRNQNSEPKLRPPAVSKSLTRSTSPADRSERRNPESFDAASPELPSMSGRSSSILHPLESAAFSRRTWEAAIHAAAGQPPNTASPIESLWRLG